MPTIYMPGVVPGYVNPYINPYFAVNPYFNPNFNPYPNFGGPGYGGGGGSGGAGGAGDVVESDTTVRNPGAKIEQPPAMVLYLSCGDPSGPGQVFQVDEDGRVLGMVNLPFTATGLALHRDAGLVAVMPRDGGHIR